MTVTLADGHVERADYVVGCDGVHSFVRNAAAIPFPGIHNPGSVILADLRLAGLPMDAAYGDLSRAGMLLVFPFRDGTCRVVLYDFARADVPVTEPVTLEEVTTSLRRVVGRDFGPSDLTWTRRYRSESRQATAYRRGRVLLAGDAAHAHSPAGRAGHEHRPAGRRQPRLEAGRRPVRVGAGLAARHLSFGTPSGRRRRARPERPPVPAQHHAPPRRPRAPLGRAPPDSPPAPGPVPPGPRLFGPVDPLPARPGRPPASRHPPAPRHHHHWRREPGPPV